MKYLDLLKELFQKDWFDPSQSFFKLLVVRLTFLIIISLSLITMWVILKHGNYSACYTSDCFNNLVIIFKVPLGLFAMLIPVIAVYAANHRSEQTKRQISLSKEQNNFINYYKHIEEFEKYTGRLGLNKYVSNINRVHMCMFGENKDTTFELTHDTLHEVTRLSKEVYLSFRRFEKFLSNTGRKDLSEREIDKSVNQQLQAIKSKIGHMYNSLYLKDEFSDVYKIEEKNEMFKPDGRTIFDVQKALKPIKSSIEVVNDLLLFSTNYDILPTFYCLMDMDLDKVNNVYKFHMAKLSAVERSAKYSIQVHMGPLNERIKEFDDGVDYGRFGIN